MDMKNPQRFSEAVPPAIQVDIVISHLAPTLGMEKAALEVRDLLRDDGFDVRMICLGGTAADVEVGGSGTVLAGPPIRGLARLNVFRAMRARRLMRVNAATVLVGLWAAIPYLLFGHGPTPAVIVWEHSLISEKIASNRTLPLFMKLAKLLYPRADAVVGVSDPLRNELQVALPKTDVRAIPNPVEVPEALDRPNVRVRDRVLMAGSLTTTKNQRVAFEALAQMKHSVRLVVAGDGPDREALTALAWQLGISDRVEFLGLLPPTLVAEEMCKASVLLHCAVGETFGYVYFEAAHRDLPVVAVHNQVSDTLVPRFVPGLLSLASPTPIANAVETILSNGLPAETFESAHLARRDEFGREAILRAWRSLLTSSARSTQ